MIFDNLTDHCSVPVPVIFLYVHARGNLTPSHMSHSPLEDFNYFDYHRSLQSTR